VVVGRTHRPHAYAELLVALAAQMPRSVLFHPAASSAMAAGPLPKRIRRILQLEDDPMLISGKSFVLVLAGLLVAATLSVLYLPSIGQAEESAAQIKELTTEDTESTEEAQKDEKKVTAESDEALAKPTDDWLRDINFASPADRAIAARAWRELGIKVAPPTEEDFEQVNLRRYGYRGGLKLIDFEHFPHLEEPFILTEFYSKPYSTGIAGFRDLERALDANAASTDDRIGLNGLSKDAEFNYAGRRPTNAARQANELTTKDTENAETEEDRQHIVQRSQTGHTVADKLAADNEELRSLFKASEENPIETRAYEVSPSAREMLSNMFEGWQKDPYGPKLEFEAVWTQNSGRLRIRAPKSAHEKLFAKVIEWSKQEGNQRDDDVDSSNDQRVIATLPYSVLNESPNEFLRAVEAARKDGSYVDLVERDEKMALVVARPPTESDWPNILGDPPRKDRVIAEKAWQRLGLKLTPASRLETLEFGLRATQIGVKILGGNVPKGLPLPAFLKRIGDREIGDFDQLHVWFNSKDGQTTKPVKVYAFADGHEYLFETQPIGETRADVIDPAPASNKASKFPSLEDQRLADLAWKRLGLELESLGEADLKRVRALGYDGGLKIVGGQGEIASQDKQIIWDDILVGLHAWPTTSLKDVAAVLARDDLEELNPLKFYVVRHTAGTSPFGGDGSPMQDTVISGRIRVREDDERRSIRTRSNLAPLRMPWEEHKPTSSIPEPGSTKTHVKTFDADATADEVNKAVRELQKATTGADPFAGPVQVELIPHDQGSALVVRGPAASNVEPVLNKAKLRYDGKYFDEWRENSRTELSTDRRLQAVKALAAFARAGYGKEALEAILDIAGEYDFRRRVSRNSVEGQLWSEIMNSLASRSSIDPTIAFSMLLDRFGKSPEKWQGLLSSFLARQPKLEGSALEQVRALFEHEEADVRSAALRAIVGNDPVGSAGLLTAALDDPGIQATALDLLAAAERQRTDQEQGATATAAIADFPIEDFMSVLFRSDPARPNPDGGMTAFVLLPRLATETAAKLAAALTEVLNDPEREADHITAVRAIGAIGRKAVDAKPVLERVYNESKDLRLRVAIAHALDRIDGGVGFRGRLMNDFIERRRDERADAERNQQQQELERLINEEQQLRR
jgi:hypothetical protein